MARGDQERAKTHCPFGHPYEGDNLYVYTKPNGRTARGCVTRKKAHARAYADRRRKGTRPRASSG